MPVSHVSGPPDDDDDEDLFARLDREAAMADQTYVLTDKLGHKIVAFTYYVDPKTGKPCVVSSTFEGTQGCHSTRKGDRDIYESRPYTAPDGREYYSRAVVAKNDSRDFHDWHIVLHQIDVAKEKATKNLNRAVLIVCSFGMAPLSMLGVSFLAMYEWLVMTVLGIGMLTLAVKFHTFPLWWALLPTGIPLLFGAVYHFWDIVVAKTEHRAEGAMIAGLITFFTLLYIPGFLITAALVWRLG